MESKPLWVALIGTGFMGRAHSNAFRHVGAFFPGVDFKMQVACGRDPERTTDFANRWGWNLIETDWENVIRDPNIDVVDVALPNNLHKDVAIAALRAGKHVLCEKPLAGTYADSKSMMETAGERPGQGAYAWYNYRRVPALALAQKLICVDKAIGPVVQVYGSYPQSWGGAGTPAVWRFDKEVAGSGSQGDLLAHIIDMIRFVTGDEFELVTGAMLETVHKRRKEATTAGADISGGPAKSRKRVRSTVDDICMSNGRLKGGALVQMSSSRVMIGSHNNHGIWISGDRGAIRFNFEDMNCLQYFDARTNQGNPAELQGWRTISATLPCHPYMAGMWPPGHIIGYEHTFMFHLADVFAELTGQQPQVALPTFRDAHCTQRVLEAINRCAAKNGETVNIWEVA